jgi:hypothetical protein
MTPTITIDSKRKCLSEQFYSYKRISERHFIRISLLNVPGQLKNYYNCTPEEPIQSLINKVKIDLDERYNNSSRMYTDVSCLTLELELTRWGDEGEFEDDRTKNGRREFSEEQIKTVYRFDYEEAEQMIFGMEVTGLRGEISR